MTSIDFSSLRPDSIGCLRLNNYTLPKFIELVKSNPKQNLIVKYARPEWSAEEISNSNEMGHYMAKKEYPHMCEDWQFKHLCQGMSREEAMEFEHMRGVRIDVWALFTVKLYDIPGLYIAEVDVEWHDDAPGHTNLEEKYSLDSDHFPNFVLYNQQNPKGLMYHGQVNYQDIALWLDVKSDLAIPHDSIAEHDEDVYKFFFDDDSKKQKIVTKMSKLAASRGDRKIPHYLKTFQKIMEHDEKYIEKELKRTGEILMEKLPGNTRTELTHKWKVLHAFNRIWKAGKRGEEM